MQKNTILTLLAVVGFIFLWDMLVVSKYTPARPPLPTVTDTSEKVNTAKVEAALQAPAAPTVPLTSPTQKDALIPLSAEGTEAIFLTGGARVASWRVLEKSAWLELLMPEAHRNASPLEMYPDLEYAAQKTSDSSVVFTAQHPSGFLVTKTVKLLAKPPFHSVSVSITNNGANEILVDTFLGWGNGLDKHHVGQPYEKDKTGAEASAVAYAGNARRWRAGFIFGRRVDLTDSASFSWVGVDNHHFLAALVAPEGQTIPKIRVRADREHPPVAGAVIDGRLKPGESITKDYLLYVGPKSTSILKPLGYSLDKAVDYGMFGFIAKALLHALTFFHGLTGNWGWAIVLLTLAIQVVIFPLTKKSLEHSVKMRELQPHLKKLQEQHKDDPKRYQAEMMNFYRKKGMKFMGLEGCLPVLLQMPIFFAFYTSLNNAYELRGAEWIFWIKDLGVKDPYYVLPVVMGAGMFLQSKLSGATMDPAQQKMMMIMPIMFTFMFLSMPAGLVLYWCVNSLVTIAITQILTFHRQRSGPTVEIV